jgi:hypothetical protein
MAVVTFSNIKGSGGGTLTGITFLNSDYTLDFIESAVTEAVDSALTGYTKTVDFATINGSAITEGGNLVIEAGDVYSAGTNIDITDNVISVTGITIPTSNTAFTNDAGYITSGEAQTQINDSISGLATTEYVDNSVSGKMDASGMSAYTTTSEVEDMVSGFTTSGEVQTQIDNATSALASTTYVDDAVSGKMDTSAMSSYTPTSGFSTINGSAITSGDNLVIEGTPYSGGTGIDITDHVVSVTGDYETVIELTQQQYDALTAYSENTTYIITDAHAIDMSAYTPTSGFSTINGSAITEGGNITVEETPYSAGTNIAISDHVISVTGISVPTKVSDLQNDLNFVDSGDVSTQIENAISGKADSSALTEYYTSAQTNTAISNATSGLASTTYVDNSVSGKQDTLVSGTNIKTINNESLLGSGNINISGGSGSANIIELTQAEYDALTAYTEDAMYVITDAEEIDMENYYTSAQTNTAIQNSVSGKADAASVSSNTGRQFPRWNSQGIVTGTTGNTVYERNISINGTNNSVLRPTNSDMTGIYAPTGAGSQGQVLQSNGSGAPGWSTFKFAFMTQAEYDLITPDASTIYFITD